MRPHCSASGWRYAASLPARVVRFYVDGFRSMTVGRYLWAMIILKVVLLMLVFKLIFFPDLLQRDYDTDEQRARAVRTDMLRKSPSGHATMYDINPNTNLNQLL